jgi:hypothetical protein
MRSFTVYTIHQKYITGMIKRSIRWAVHVARMVETRNAYKMFAGKRDGIGSTHEGGEKCTHNFGDYIQIL